MDVIDTMDVMDVDESQVLPLILSLLPELSDAGRETLRNALTADAVIRSESNVSEDIELRFEETRPDATLSIQWQHGQITFSRRERRRYALVKSLYLSDDKTLSGAEVAEKIYRNDLKKWNAIRLLGYFTEKKILEPNKFPFIIIQENQTLKLIRR
jgi:hypothetical protein